MNLREPPNVEFPSIGPLTRATLFADFDQPDLDARTIDWDAEISVIINQRLAATALRTLHDLGVDLPAGVETRLNEATFYGNQASCVASSKAAVHLKILVSSGINFVVVKGPGIASLATRLIERPYTDIDIFVSSEDFHRAINLLAMADYQEESRNFVPWPRLSQRVREAINVRTPSGGSVDIHHRIPPWYWGSDIRFADVLSRSSARIVPGGGELLCASPVDNLIISALHIISDKNSPGSTLMAWRDFLLLAHSCDPDEVLVRAHEVRLAGWIKWIMNALPDQTLPPSLSQRFVHQRPAIRGATRLHLMMPPGWISEHSALSQLFRLPVSNAAMYVAGMVWPSRLYLDSRSNEVTSRFDWWRGALRQPR